MNLLAVLDGAGVYGSLLHYSFVVAFVGSAFLIFICIWWKGKLNMDEGPKFQMMQEQEEKPAMNNDDPPTKGKLE